MGRSNNKDIGRWLLWMLGATGVNRFQRYFCRTEVGYILVVHGTCILHYSSTTVVLQVCLLLCVPGIFSLSSLLVVPVLF